MWAASWATSERGTSSGTGGNVVPYPALVEATRAVISDSTFSSSRRLSSSTRRLSSRSLKSRPCSSSDAGDIDRDAGVPDLLPTWTKADVGRGRTTAGLLVPTPMPNLTGSSRTLTRLIGIAREPSSTLDLTPTLFSLSDLTLPSPYKWSCGCREVLRGLVEVFVIVPVWA